MFCQLIQFALLGQFLTYFTHTMVSGRSNQRETAREVLMLARQARAVFPRGGFRGLDAAELQVLLSVLLDSGRLVREIADELEMPRSSVSSALTRLEQKHLLSRTTDATDARTQRMDLTTTGKALARRFLTDAAEHLSGR